MPDTYVDGTAGDELVFKFEDTTTPGTFTESASINTDRSVDFSSEVSASVRVNTTDRTKPGRVKRRVKSTDLKFDGAGTADKAASYKLVQLQQAGQAFNGKLIQAGSPGWTITGKWVIDSIKMGGAHGEDQTFSISISIADTDYTITSP